MAGSRSYDSNILTNAKDPVRISSKITCGGAATSYTVTNGKGISVAHTAGSNDVVVTFPEKFGKCVWLKAEYVPAGASDTSSVAKVSSDYSPTTGKATFVTGARAATNNGAFSALNDPAGVIYLDAAFELRV